MVPAAMLPSGRGPRHDVGWVHGLGVF